MSRRLLLSPGGVSFDDRATEQTRQLWYGAGHDVFRMPPEDQAVSSWEFRGVDDHGARWVYVQDDYQRALVPRSGPVPIHAAPTVPMGVGGDPGEGSPGFQATPESGVKVFDATGARTFDTEERSLYISDVFEGGFQAPGQLNDNSNHVRVSYHTIGTVPLDSTFKIGFIETSRYYVNPLSRIQISDCIFLDQYYYSDRWVYYTFIQLQIVNGTVRFRVLTYLYGDWVSAGEMNVKYKVWVGKYN